MNWGWVKITSNTGKSCSQRESTDLLHSGVTWSGGFGLRKSYPASWKLDSFFAQTEIFDLPLRTYQAVTGGQRCVICLHTHQHLTFKHQSGFNAESQSALLEQVFGLKGQTELTAWSLCPGEGRPWSIWSKRFYPPRRAWSALPDLIQEKKRHKTRFLNQ